MLFVTTYDSIGETEEVGEKAIADERIVEWILEGNKHNQYVSGAVDRFFTTIKDTRE